MTRQELINQIFTKKTFLCVGLDTDIKKIPEHLLKEEDPIFAFNKAIIDATAPYCVAYKPNLAFYESMGVKGWISFEKTIQYLNENYPQHFIIADAKRGDIGNTSAMYARTFFEEINLDALTVAPYMGEDKEFLVTYTKEYMKTHPDIDFFIYGHRHIELDLMLSRKTRMMILGDWIWQFTYAVFDGEHMFMEEYVEGESRP